MAVHAETPRLLPVAGLPFFDLGFTEDPGPLTRAEQCRPCGVERDCSDHASVTAVAKSTAEHACVVAQVCIPIANVVAQLSKRSGFKIVTVVVTSTGPIVTAVIARPTNANVCFVPEGDAGDGSDRVSRREMPNEAGWPCRSHRQPLPSHRTHGQRTGCRCPAARARAQGRAR
jgi:hypothetical protein